MSYALTAFTAGCALLCGVGLGFDSDRALLLGFVGALAGFGVSHVWAAYLDGKAARRELDEPLYVPTDWQWPLPLEPTTWRRVDGTRFVWVDGEWVPAYLSVQSDLRSVNAPARGSHHGPHPRGNGTGYGD